MRRPEDPSLFDPRFTSFISIGMIVSLKLPAAKIALRNISHSIILHRLISWFSVSSAIFMIPLNASL